jgi:hypothetical protein
MFHFEEYIMADSSSESNPVVMEKENTWKIPVLEEENTWKISVVSRDIGPDNWMDAKLTSQLQEHYALKQAFNIFLMPHHPPYNSLIARTRSFEHADWPETNPSHVSLAEDELFYDRKLITF